VQLMCRAIHINTAVPGPWLAAAPSLSPTAGALLPGSQAWCTAGAAWCPLGPPSAPAPAWPASVKWASREVSEKWIDTQSEGRCAREMGAIKCVADSAPFGARASRCSTRPPRCRAPGSQPPANGVRGQLRERRQADRPPGVASAGARWVLTVVVGFGGCPKQPSTAALQARCGSASYVCSCNPTSRPHLVLGQGQQRGHRHLHPQHVPQQGRSTHNCSRTAGCTTAAHMQVCLPLGH